MRLRILLRRAAEIGTNLLHSNEHVLYCCHDVMQRKPFVCFQENPYVMLRQNHQELEGNDRYEGFCVDMLKELADILKFKYRIRLVGDGVYGVPGANGTWTGMVGELISRVCKYLHMQRL